MVSLSNRYLAYISSLLKLDKILLNKINITKNAMIKIMHILCGILISYKFITYLCALELMIEFSNLNIKSSNKRNVYF